MKKQAAPLVLEILKQDNRISMGVFEQREPVSTIRCFDSRPITIGEINKLCREMVDVLNKGVSAVALRDPVSGLKKTGRLLWDSLLSAPVKEKLILSPARGMVLYLDEELVDIPWELLYDGQDFLCLKFGIGRLIRSKSSASGYKCRTIDSPARMLVLADPTGDLKSAHKEGVHIKDKLGQRREHLSIDFKSKRISPLYVKKNLRDYDIIHFAGHSEHDSEDSGNSGWLLEGGRFTVRDILSIGEGFCLPSLVFSNSCYSAIASCGISDQVKAYNLASAFLFSGTRHYIGGVLKINDSAARCLADEFYEQLMQGAAVGDSLRLARHRLIREFSLESLHWAGHLLYGDPNFILFHPQKRSFNSAKALRARNVKWLSLFLSAACLALFLFQYIPSLNPTAYFSYLRLSRLSAKGKNNEAISLSKNILKQHPAFLKVYTVLANNYLRLGLFQDALKVYFDYAFYRQKKHDLNNLAAAYTDIGWVYHKQGDYPRAEDFYNKAIVLSRQNKDRLNEAIALRKLAVWFIDKEDYDKAMEIAW